MNWQQVEAYLYGNRVAIESAIFLVVTAGIRTMPNPSQKWLSLQTLKEWFYDGTHQFLNLSNVRMSNSTGVQPPPK